MAEIDDNDLQELREVLLSKQKEISALTSKLANKEEEFLLLQKRYDSLNEFYAEICAIMNQPKSEIPVPRLTEADRARLNAMITEVNDNTAKWENACKGLKATAIKGVKAYFGMA
jgi:hypothetical protein